MGYVFISYSTKNQASADAMRELLNGEGIETWMAPGDIPAGSKYAQVINRAVKNCDCFILLLSEDAQNSVWVAKETERAVNYRKTIIPVQIEDVVLNDEFELYISTDQVVAIQKIDRETEEIKKLLASVTSLMGIGAVEKIQTSTEYNPAKKATQKSIEVTVWSPVNTDVYLNDKRHPVMKIDHNTGFDYNRNDINVSGEFELIFVAKGFEKSVAFDADAIKDRLNYHIDAILSKKEIIASYDREEALEQIKEESTAYAYEQLSKVGTADDIPILSDELKKLSSAVSKNQHTDYLIAVCAKALGELAVKFEKTKYVGIILKVYNKYTAKSSYGYMFDPIVKRLREESDWIEIDEEHFPDEIFRNYIKENFDTDKDGRLNREEINAVTVINVFNNNSTSLKGIEYFTALETLRCYYNRLTSLDVSENTALKSLSCFNNQLTSLDVSKNTALKSLSCFNNQLTSLDVSKNTALEYLNCGYNQLTCLDMNKNPELKELDCCSNKLTNLDVSKNIELERLKCGDNQLTSLGVSGNALLKSLACYFNQLISLDVSKNTALEDLWCGHNQLTSLDVSNNTALKTLECDGNAEGFTIIGRNDDLTSKKPIGSVTIDEEHFPDEAFRNYIKENFDTDKDGMLSREEINAVTEINVSKKNCKSLKGIEYFTALTYLDCRNNQLKMLDVSKNTVLETLYCNNNQLKSLDVSRNTFLISLACHSNWLTSLDVSKNILLQKLACVYNSFTCLDISNNTALEELYCYSNKLTSLDVSKNTALKTLSCGYNQLTSLDVSNNTMLTELVCKDNSDNFILTGWTSKNERSSFSDKLDYAIPPIPEEALDIVIDEGHFPDEAFRNYIKENFDTDKDGVLNREEINAVTKIDVSEKNSTSLKGIEYFTALETLWCHNNNLTSLDVSKNTALEELICGFNQLTSLDVSKNAALEELICVCNQLTSLDVSKNTALEYLWCGHNQLTNLDVSKNIALIKLECENNKLEILNVSNNTALKELEYNGNADGFILINTNYYKSQGLCAHCGGRFSGIFKKKCTKCGKEKDY